jgi:long-chain acyl-CoA synthetase
VNKLARLITQASWEHRHRTALVCEDRRLTFAETEELSNRIASGLIRLGVQKGERVGVLLANSPEFVCTDFALIKAGLVRVPLNPRLAPPEIEFIVQNCRAAVLVFSEDYTPVVEQIRQNLPHVRHFLCVGQSAPAWAQPFRSLVAAGSPEPVAVPVTDDDPYMILYTSGTTGRPKGAVTNFRSRWVTLFHVFANEGFITKHDVMLHLASLAHGSGTKVLPHYVKGAVNVLMPKFSVEEFCRLVERERVTTTWMVPTTITMLLDFPGRTKYDLSSLKTIIYAGAPMPTERLKEALRTFGPIFVQVYGLSEAPQPDLVLPKEDHVLEGTEAQLRRLSSAGRPALGVEVRVVRPDGTDVTPGSDEIGEIILRGEHIMTEYWERPDATAEAIRDGWFYTGDLAKVDEDGYIYIVDRSKDMIISGGYNVYPREVEEALYQHPAVKECAVIGVPDPVWGEAVKACVALRPGMTATAEELIAHCGKLLAGYKKPKSVDFLEELPKSPNGKILKKVLREPYWQGYQRQVN